MMCASKPSAKKTFFAAAIMTLTLCQPLFAQTLTSGEKREQNQHKRWIETTLTRIGQSPEGNPPADILLTYAPSDQMNASQRKQEKSQRDWMVRTLKKIRAVQVGSTRGKLLKVFTTEGGLSTRTQQTFVDRTCPYIKVDVQFRLADHPRKPSRGAKPGDEDPSDVITKISPPYLAYMIID